MDRDEQLAFLAKHASNMRGDLPAAPRAPSRNLNHETVRAIIRGIGPVLKDELNALRAENALLRQRMDALEARQHT